MNKYKKLFSNSVIFTVGNFGSRLISFVMVPLYTHILNTSEYGTVDLITTTISLLVPFLTLSLDHAAIRFAIDAKRKRDQEKILSNILTHGCFISAIIILLTPFLIGKNIFEGNELLFTLLLISNIFNILLSQYIRGIGLVKQYALNGILMTVMTVASNLIFLVIFNLGVKGYIVSMIISSVISSLYLILSILKERKVELFKIDFNLYKIMLNYSIPIIPNSAMWWVINGSTRYFILFFAGASENGLYAVANKIPSIISMVTNIFSQAWQISSFEEYESKDKDTYFSEIFRVYWTFLFFMGSSLLIIIKPVLKVMVADSFYQSWQVVPMLVLAVIYQSLAGFLGTNYTASKETKGTFTTSFYAGIISLIASIIFVPILGVLGAGMSSCLSFFGMFILRFIDTQKFAKIKLNKLEFIASNIVFILQTTMLFYFEGIMLLIIEIILFIFLLLVNRTLIINFFLMLSKIFKNKFK